ARRARGGIDKLNIACGFFPAGEVDVVVHGTQAAVREEELEVEDIFFDGDPHVGRRLAAADGEEMVVSADERAGVEADEQNEQPAKSHNFSVGPAVPETPRTSFVTCGAGI